MLLIDNYITHKTREVRQKAKKLDIILCYLHTYSPQFQPIEKIWKDCKFEWGCYKIGSIEDYQKLSKKNKRLRVIELLEECFYEKCKSKNKFNKVLKNFIEPKFKRYSPEFNEDWEIQKL